MYCSKAARSMSGESRDQRRHERLYLSTSEGIIGVFTHTGHRVDLEARIVDISMGGIGLALKKDGVQGVTKGDLLVLKKVSGNPYLRPMSNIVMRIRWVLYHETLDHVGCGCEFINIPQVYGLLIQQFIRAYCLKFNLSPKRALS